MNEGSGDKDTGTKMLAEEEHLWRDFHPLHFLCDHGEASTSNGCSEHNDCMYVTVVRCDPNSAHLQTAATCRGKSYTAPSASLLHVGFSMVGIVMGITMQNDENAQPRLASSLVASDGERIEVKRKITNKALPESAVVWSSPRLNVYMFDSTGLPTFKATNGILADQHASRTYKVEETVIRWLLLQISC